MEITQEILESPLRVAEMLTEYQEWRKGIGKYEWHEDDPSKEQPMPFSPAELSKIEDAAIHHLMVLDGVWRVIDEKAKELKEKQS